MSLEDKLSTILDETTHLLEYANTPLPESQDTLGDAVKALVDGYGGGGVEVASGTFELASNVSVPTTGYTLPFTMPFMPDFVAVWFDADDFLAIETPVNNRYYRISAFRIPENVPPIYLVSNLSVQNASRNGYTFTCTASVNGNVGTASPNGYGLSNLVTATVNTKTYTNWGITDDCAVRIARYSSAGPWLYAGTYHWVAIKGIPAFFV